MLADDKLLLCPRCGGQMAVGEDGEGTGSTYAYWCNDCGDGRGSFGMLAEAIESANRRPSTADDPELDNTSKEIDRDSR